MTRYSSRPHCYNIRPQSYYVTLWFGLLSGAVEVRRLRLQMSLFMQCSRLPASLIVYKRMDFRGSEGVYVDCVLVMFVIYRDGKTGLIRLLQRRQRFPMDTVPCLAHSIAFCLFAAGVQTELCRWPRSSSQKSWENRSAS